MIAEDWRYSNLKRIQDYLDEKGGKPSEVSKGKEFSELLEPYKKIGVVIPFFNGILGETSAEFETLAKNLVFEDHLLLEFNKAEAKNKYCLTIDSTSTKPMIIAYGANLPRQAYQLEIHVKNQANIVEVFVSDNKSDETSLVSAFMEITLSPGANLKHTVINHGGKKNRASHFLNVVQHQNSNAEMFNLSLGGEWARFDVRNYLRDPGAKSSLGGLYLKSESEFVDHCTKVFHEAPNTESSQLYKGVLGGSSRAIFNGVIKIEEDCPESKTNQMNRNLIVSKKAEAISRPQLEILTDNVKANHGMTIGNLNPNEVFYLTSRGIPEETAHDMLADAFVNEVTDQYVGEALSPMVKGLIALTWPQLRGALR